ncbi:MAG: helix-hairpin-helix domain-containing protein [Oscillibacter sp.]|nr:helix-hairpin-helix domain-containing protein [Oscillibacter sp.]
MSRASSLPVTVRTERDAAREELAPEPLMVDINTAGAEELAQLPGIGEELAGRIVAHREAHGPFETIEDILEVSGIGEGKFAAFAAYITADGKETT